MNRHSLLPRQGVARGSQRPAEIAPSQRARPGHGKNGGSKPRNRGREDGVIMKSRKPKQVRYAVVGLGHIAQGAVLPGFRNASNSKLTALVSDDSTKLRELGRRYRVADRIAYKDYDAYLRGGNVDAVYIALPNNLHCDFTIRAAQAGVHVLCEKPLAATENECQEMIWACAENHVQLMTAYRLHFERANLEAIRIVNSGKIGEPRIFQSLFTMQVKPGNIRLDKKLTGGTLYDIGIYCINAARYLFRAEPTEVIAFSDKNDDARFREVDEMTSAVLRFPEGRLASFTASFGAADAAVYTLTGTRGHVKLSQAYEYSEPAEMELTVGSRTQRREYALRDQFGPELIHFSDCILRNRNPEPSGIEGLIDVHIIQSLYESARTGRRIVLKDLGRQRRPDLRQEIYRPPTRRPAAVNAASPTR
jgi:glucose-fructose oxidoreductase